MKGVRKRIVVIVGLKQAKIGFVFLYEGHLEECEDCELFKVCMENLEVGRVYRIVNVRAKEFPCKVHEDGVKVVEVVESEIEAAVESRLKVPSVIMTFTPQHCEKASCIYYANCQPKGLVSGDKCSIIEIIDRIKCPLKRSLILATLARVNEQSSS